MAHTPSRFPFPSPAPTTPMSVPMLTEGNGNAVAGQEFAGQGAAKSHFEAVGFGTGTSLLARHGVNMNFSGPVHVHVDNMYMYDGEQLRRTIQLTQARALENGLIAPLAQPAIAAPSPAKAPRKRNPPKKKGSVSDPAQVTTTGTENGNDGDSPAHTSD
ncbi:hypothetical protein Ocin01_18936 [Orchesella cincta]|uniref:Uncharacterized protein n=1 Tax=Orchesella cincta TaxID=48709 RepID=A0A1D2M441_ORCCI|nr:hypothetical protein Ocin01_18936 [Orchesella cincta]